MKIFIKLYLFLLTWIGICGASFGVKPQFYIGINFQKSFQHGIISYGEENYGKEELKNAYSPGLAEKTKSFFDTVSKEKFVQGGPIERFEVILENAESKIYDEKKGLLQFSGIAGAYLYRKGIVLVATEIYFGKNFTEINKNIEKDWVKEEIPENLKNNLNNVKENGRTIENGWTKITGVQDNYLYSMQSSLHSLVFLDVSIKMNEDISIEKTFFTGLNLHVGNLIKEKIYLFAILGAEAQKIIVKNFSKKNDLKEIYVAICASSFYDTKQTWYETNIVPKKDSIKELSFSENKLNFGINYGLGFELFLTHRISIRGQFVRTNYGNITISSKNKEDSLDLSFSENKLNAGILFRF